MAQVQYERIHKKLLPTDAQRAIWMSHHPSEKARVIEWVDTECPGLVLRITKRDANWLIRRRDTTLRIGPCTEVDLSAARHITFKTRDAAKRGRNLKTFVKTLAGIKTEGSESFYKDSRDDAWKYADEIADEKTDWGRRYLRSEFELTWTWRNATDRFLEAKLPKLKKSYRTEYEHYLRLPEFDCVADRRLDQIEMADLELVRDRMFKIYAASTVHRAIEQAKAMLNWTWTYHSAAAGLSKCPAAWWDRWKVDYRSNVRTRRPLIEELARTMVLADEFRHLADGEHETYSGTVCGLWMAVLLAQRTGALLMMRPDRLFAPEKALKLPGWKIANWTFEEMKGGRDGGRPHSLPVPPRALEVVERFRRQQSRKSEWIFSAKRPEDRLTQSALNNLMYRLQGRVFDHRKKLKPDRPGKPGPKPAVYGKIRRDLFAEFGVKPWTLHDVRRSLTRFLDDARLGGAASAILGHKLPQDKMPEEERMADVTEQHYNSSQRLALKAEGIKLWVDAILDACERERRKIRNEIVKRRRSTTRQSRHPELEPA